MPIGSDLAPTRSSRRLLTAGRVAAGTAAAVALTLVGFAAPAGAHVSPDKTEVPAGGYTDIKLGVGHGCEGSPTTKLEVQIPAEIANVTPYVVPGWDVEVTTETLDEPIEGSHGEQITERDAVVTWTAEPGNELPDGFKMQFGLSFQVPDAEGTVLHFPSVQTCVEGATDWIQIPVEGEEEPPEPAPSVTIIAGSGDGHGGGGDEGAEDGSDTEATTTTAPATEDSSDSSDDSGSSNGLAIAGLVAGLAGLGVGGAAFAKSRN